MTIPAPVLRRNAPHPTRSNAQATRAAAVVLACGGTGVRASKTLRENYLQDGAPFPMSIIGVDTDKIDAPWLDRALSLSLSPAAIEVLLANPENFSPEVQAILQRHEALLDPEHSQHGARTVRPLSQVAFDYHRERVVLALRAEIMALHHVGAFSEIVVAILSSSGGGSGSALSLLLAHSLTDRQFADEVNIGLAIRPRRPRVFAAQPFTYADDNDPIQADKILGNAYAFQLEAAELQRQSRLEYAFFIGLTNARGTVVDTPLEIARVLGASVYGYLQCFTEIESILADYSVHAITGRDRGHDVPEKRLSAPDPSLKNSSNGAAS